MKAFDDELSDVASPESYSSKYLEVTANESSRIWA
jgi:hypothetical protein